MRLRIVLSVGLGFIGALTGALLLAVLTPHRIESLAAQGALAQKEPVPVHRRTTANPEAWLERSPFALDRSAYRRLVAAPAPQPPRPRVEVRLIGVTTIGDDLVALVTIDGRELQVALGADTAAGQVAELGRDYIVFSGDQPARRVSLFD